MQTILKTDNLSKSYGSQKALDNITFEVNKGEIFGIVGPDGAGKTTLMRILAGVLSKTSGKVSIMGLDIDNQRERIKNHIGYMSQKFNMYPTLTVQENIEFFSGIFNIDKKVYRQRVPYLLSLTGLTDFTERQAKNLSGGMKQKLALVATLVHMPDILILDEPTVGVDPVSRRDFWDILQEFSSKGTTIIISTSYMNEAELCNRIVLLFNGKIIQQGDPITLKKIDKIILELKIPGNKKVDDKIIDKIKSSCEEFVIKGNKIRVVIDKNIKDKFIKDNSRIFKIQEMSPSIEDVFVSSIA